MSKSGFKDRFLRCVESRLCKNSNSRSKHFNVTSFVELEGLTLIGMSYESKKNAHL